MEGIPNLTPAFIIEAKNEQEAIKKYPKEIKKNMMSNCTFWKEKE